MTSNKKSGGLAVLVGAGSGDENLITIAGRDWLSRAEVVVYDRLANPALLRYAPATAELIFAGKKPGYHAMTQEQINQTLVEKTAQGKLVVRLKGGDPLIFGRGGEEASALVEAGLDFRIVPGITAAISAGAYAGIPMTDRRAGSSLVLVTGHEDPTKNEAAVDFDAIARIDTAVFYMGISNLELIADKLIQAGKNPETPVALVENATHPKQRTLTGTLENLAKLARENNVKPPALIIVGPGTKMHDSLGWFEKLPLAGQRIIVTRSRLQQSQLAQKLQLLGADVIEAPTIKIEDVADDAPVLRALEKLTQKQFDWVVFTSPNGVEKFVSQCRRHKFDSRILAGCKIAAVGPGTQKKLAEYFLHADFIPTEFTAAQLGKQLANFENLSGRSMLLVRSDIAPDTLPSLLKQAGAQVTDCAFYVTAKPADIPQRARELLDADQIDWVTFSSSSTAENFIALTGQASLEHVKTASIGPVTSDALEKLGLKPTVQATHSTIESLVQSIVEAEGNL